MKKTLLLFISFLLITLICKSQDIIIKRSGDEIKTKVTEIGLETIKYKMFDNKNGPTYTILKSDIFMIKYENGSKDVFNKGEANPDKTNQNGSNQQSTDNDNHGVSTNANAKSSIQIFSEFSGVTVYLDDVNKGNDIKTIDSVLVGSHFLKLTKDSVTIYGELIAVNANTPTIILVKDSKQIQDKLLASKYKEQQKYKAMKLDILLSTQYVTQTSTETNKNTNSLFFPDYYSVLGMSNSKTNTNTTAVTYAIKEWFATTNEGRTQITEFEFATLVQNQYVLNRYQQEQDQIDRQNKKNKRKSNVAGAIGMTLFIPGFICGVIGGINYAFKPEKRFIKDSDVSLGLVLGGIGAALIGAVIVGVDTGGTRSHNEKLHFFSLEDAIAEANKYNQKLKEELGLPLNYEP